MEKFEGDILIRQRIVPNYRVPFFKLLAERCRGTVYVVAGQPQAGEGISTCDQLEKATLISVENRYRGNGLLLRYSQPKLIDAIKEIQPRIVVTEANPRFSDMNLIISCSRDLGIPAVGWGIGTTDFWNRPFKKLRSWVRTRRILRLDGMLCYGTKACAQYHDVGFSKDRTFVLYNSTVCRPAGEQPDRVFKSASGVAVLLFVGRLIESKGIDRLIRASAIAQEKGAKIKVQIVGDGPAELKLRQLTADLNAPVVFLGRKIGGELAEVSRQSDLFVLPGLGGLAIQEAMAHGLPVIVTEADGTEIDLVRGNGWIIEKENVEELAKCIVMAASDLDDLRRRGRESFRIVKEEINLDRMADRFILAVQNLVHLGSR